MTNILCTELLSLASSNCTILDQMHCGSTPGMKLYILLKGQPGCSRRKKNTNYKSFLFLGLMCILFGRKGRMNKIPVLRILICFLQNAHVGRDLGKLLISVHCLQEGPYTSPPTQTDKTLQYPPQSCEAQCFFKYA